MEFWFCIHPSCQFRPSSAQSLLVPASPGWEMCGLARHLARELVRRGFLRKGKVPRELHLGEGEIIAAKAPPAGKLARLSSIRTARHQNLAAAGAIAIEAGCMKL